MDIFKTIVDTANKLVWDVPETLPWLVVTLLGTGLVVTTWLGFIQLRRVGHAIRVVMGKYDDPDDPGDVNHFQALSTALSATVGIGNIAGVATAIHLGGPGAVLWMWVTAIFGMGLKFAECTLAIRYRDFDDRGEAAGGPMYYIQNGLGRSWKPLAVFFAACAVVASFGGGNMNQANTVAVSANAEFGIASWLVGGFLVIVVGGVILGGIKSIARVASALAPSMALLYVSAALLILIFNAGDVPAAFGTIVSSAMDPVAGVTGAGTGVFLTSLLWGVKRGLFSNEAGQGSAPIAHAAAKTNEPVREGAVAMLGPLIDTLIICTMTALVIVTTGVWDKKHSHTVDMGAEVTVVAPDGFDGQTLEVENGALTAPVDFKVFDAVVENPNIIDSDGKAFTGTFDFGDGGSVDVPGVRLTGDMLLTSSALTAASFQSGLQPIGDFGGMVVTICVFLFAISTMVSWSYYGDRCVTYLFGSKYVIVYRFVFLGFVYVGSTTALKTVWAYGDLALGLMTAPNLIAILLLMPKVVELTRDYFRRMDASGKK